MTYSKKIHEILADQNLKHKSFEKKSYNLVQNDWWGTSHQERVIRPTPLCHKKG